MHFLSNYQSWIVFQNAGINCATTSNRLKIYTLDISKIRIIFNNYFETWNNKKSWNLRLWAILHQNLWLFLLLTPYKKQLLLFQANYYHRPKLYILFLLIFDTLKVVNPLTPVAHFFAHKMVFQAFNKEIEVFIFSRQSIAHFLYS